ncbi:GMP/IMP nucleotidase [Thiohalobacter sp.]|uniref:GMP/IMP nucleotidase n=1 Tax=Thiohalobacter sp. TaxID=2025948 RepID=UPI00261CFA3C|nr:GMP/IMP nucleotidase [Thiohalobacter sp.]
MPPWSHIDTLLLDMDGTLLDLHFDNHFWREHVPLRYAERNDLALEAAKAELFPRFQAAEGTMAWYCVDYWSEVLDMDIAELKREVDHLIAVHPHVTDFLDLARARGKRVLLVTNAHQKALDLKMEKTRLGGHFDRLICAHDYGKPKEDPSFWDWLAEREPFDRERTLLIDDSLPVLRSAREYGIRHLLAVRRPDTRGPDKDTEEFEAVEGFDALVRGLQGSIGKP